MDAGLLNMNKACNFLDHFESIKLDLHGVRLPTFEIDKKYKQRIGVSEDVDNFNFLKALCILGIKNLNLEKEFSGKGKYKERALHELNTLKDLGFIDYTLLVWDVINFCNENDIPTGPGRGSSAGSLVLYLIGVTKIDPIKYDLYFERFVSKIRAKKKIVDGITYLDGSLMCDVDLDICYYNRPKVIKYLEEKFPGKTSKILTLNTLNTKLLIKECGKIIGDKSEDEMSGVTLMIPKVFGLVKDIEESYNEVKEFKEWCDDNKDVYKIALKLRGLIKNKGVHPSGMLLSHSLMKDSCPIELSSDKDDVSSYDMNWASLFNVKLDLLGLRSVSVADDVCKMIGIKISEIDLNDPIIYQSLQDLKTPHGIFQIEADMAYRVSQAVKPKNLNELSAVLAIARPGAMGFIKQYADYCNTGEYTPIHPFFDDILKDTGGVALYQEQLMKMANKIGFSLDEAELLRRIVGKKKTSEVKVWKEKIKTKIKENNLDEKVGEIFWKVLEDSSNYSFNKSHSIAYSALSAITVYLKFKHPKEFFLSLLKMTKHEPDAINEISKIQKELSSFGIKLLPPHLMKSEMSFSIEDGDIRFGLLSIKGISDKSIEKLNNFRNRYANKFEAFKTAKQSGLSIGALSALIQAGALGGFNETRSKSVYEAQLWNLLSEKEKMYAIKFGEEFNFNLVNIIKKLTEFKGNDNKVVIKESRFETIKRDCEPYKKIYEVNKKSEEYANWYYEKKLLGYSSSTTLNHIYGSVRAGLIFINEFKKKPVNYKGTFVGVIEEIFSRVSKNKKKYLKIKISDETSFTDVLMFNESAEEFLTTNNGLPEENSIVLVKGTKKEDCIFANFISVQSNKFYTKLSEMKEPE